MAQTTAPTTTSCLGHYWPIANRTVIDTITGQLATSKGSPKFVADRNGQANGAIWVNGSLATAWQLPAGIYIQGDTTVTMWVKKIACQYGCYGMILMGLPQIQIKKVANPNKKKLNYFLS
jgi:hypothetical protein